MEEEMALYQHRFRGTTEQSELFVFSWWAQSNRSLSAANAAAVTWLADLMAGATAGNGLEDHLTTGVIFDRVSTGEITPSTGTQVALAETSITSPGVVATAALPADVALCISLRTALANRRGRGRFYLPQPSAASSTTTGLVSSDTITDLGASLEAAWTGYNTGTDRPVVYSRASRSSQNITSYDIGNHWDTQRRRDNSQTESRTSTSMP